MFPNQNQNYANLLQGNSLRVVAAPAQQPVRVFPAFRPSPVSVSPGRPIAQPIVSPQTTSVNLQKGRVVLQPQRAFNQQQPQIGVTAWNLHTLANPATPIYEYANVPGVPFGKARTLPGYGGYPGTSGAMALRIQTPNYPLLKKLPYQ